MSFDRELPPVVFGEEPKYIAIWLERPHTVRAPLSSSGLKTMEHWPGVWTWHTNEELIEKLSGQTTVPTPGAPAPVTGRLKQITADTCSDLDRISEAFRRIIAELEKLGGGGRG